MADSDEEYVGSGSEDEIDAHMVSSGAGTRSARKKQRGGATFEVSRTWESVVEGADGTISSTVEGLLEAGKRKRYSLFVAPICDIEANIISHSLDYSETPHLYNVESFVISS